MELIAQDEFGRYSTVEEPAETGSVKYIHFFDRSQLVALLASLEQKLVQKNLILTMIDTPRFGTVE